MTETSADHGIEVQTDPVDDEVSADEDETETSETFDSDAVELETAGVPAVETDDSDPGDWAAGDVDPEAGVDVAVTEPAEVREERSGSRVQQLEEEGDIAADYLEGLLDIADQDGDIDLDVEGDRASVSVVGDELTVLVGDHGVVLEALQELTRLAVYRETGERSRLMLDIGGFRAEKRRALESLARDAAEEVKESGEAVKLSPMTPFERKVVHDAVAEQGLRSESEGVEPARCVVVMPAE